MAQPNRQVDIIIPVWNLRETTAACVESLAQHTDHPYRLIIVDDASGPDTADYLKGLAARFQGFVLIRNEKNQGFVRSVNRALGESRSDLVCVLNNDTVLTDGWLSELIAVLAAYPSIGVLNPSSNTSGQSSGAMGIDEFARTLVRYRSEVQYLTTARGFCMLIRRAVFEKIGYFDDAYHMGYFEETDFCMRAHKAGFKVARAKASYVYHKESKSFALRPERDELFKRNEELFCSRWGRRLRVAYFVNRSLSPERRRSIDELVRRAAESGHQVMVFIARGLPWPVTIDHWDIRRVDIGSPFFAVTALYQVMRRKTKKPVHIVALDDQVLGTLMKGIVRLHGADVLIAPEPEQLASLLERKSRAKN